MIVATCYVFHDHEPKMYLVRTDQLNANHKFEAALKKALCSGKSHVQIDGTKFEDEWGRDLARVSVPKSQMPVMVDRLCWAHVNFDGGDEEVVMHRVIIGDPRKKAPRESPLAPPFFPIDRDWLIEIGFSMHPGTFSDSYHWIDDSLRLMYVPDDSHIETGALIPAHWRLGLRDVGSNAAVYKVLHNPNRRFIIRLLESLGLIVTEIEDE